MKNLATKEPILDHVLDRIQSFENPTRDFLCIFDLDSTLYDLTDRKQQILLSFLKQNENLAKFQDERTRLEAVEVRQNEFGIDQALERVGISAKTHPEFYKLVYTFWEFYFFHNDFVKFDTTFAGAVEYVRKIDALGAQIIYLSGRDEPRMMAGTRLSLENSGFPVKKANIEICLKPHSKISDHHFKLDFMLALESKYKEVWLFENEPVNINLIEKHCPNTKFVFIDSNHSGRERVGDHHFVIKDFK